MVLNHLVGELGEARNLGQGLGDNVEIVEPYVRFLSALGHGRKATLGNTVGLLDEVLNRRRGHLQIRHKVGNYKTFTARVDNVTLVLGTPTGNVIVTERGGRERVGRGLGAYTIGLSRGELGEVGNGGTVGGRQVVQTRLTGGLNKELTEGLGLNATTIVGVVLLVTALERLERVNKGRVVLDLLGAVSGLNGLLDSGLTRGKVVNLFIGRVVTVLGGLSLELGNKGLEVHVYLLRN